MQIMKSKIIITSGQTCNKFFSLLKPLHDAWTTNRRQTVLIPDKDLPDYDNLVNSQYLYFPLWSPKLSALLGRRRYEDLIGRVFYFSVIKNPLFPSFLKRKMFLHAWEYRGFKVEGDFLDLVRETFRPNTNIIESVDKEFNRYIDYTVIGVHIRRGDYKDFRNGIFYFTDDVWVNILKLLVSNSDKKIVFFISTNEKIDWNNYKDFETFSLKEIQGPSADLYGLSKCDYIIGPPSTFSNWAALIGEKPLCFVYNKDNPEIRFRIPRNMW